MAESTMATLQEAYAEYLRIACADPYDHAPYEAADARVKELVVAVYGEPLAEYANEWLADCNEVPRLHELRERWLADRMYDLKEAATRAAHAVDLNWEGKCTVEAKDEVADKFREMVRLMDQIQTVDPELDREETLALAMVHAMTEKALDYGIEVK